MAGTQNSTSSSKLDNSWFAPLAAREQFQVPADTVYHKLSTTYTERTGCTRRTHPLDVGSAYMQGWTGFNSPLVYSFPASLVLFVFLLSVKFEGPKLHVEVEFLSWSEFNVQRRSSNFRA